LIGELQIENWKFFETLDLGFAEQLIHGLKRDIFPENFSENVRALFPFKDSKPHPKNLVKPLYFFFLTETRYKEAKPDKKLTTRQIDNQTPSYKSKNSTSNEQKSHNSTSLSYQNIDEDDNNRCQERTPGGSNSQVHHFTPRPAPQVLPPQ